MRVSPPTPRQRTLRPSHSPHPQHHHHQALEIENAAYQRQQRHYKRNVRLAATSTAKVADLTRASQSAAAELTDAQLRAARLEAELREARAAQERAEAGESALVHEKGQLLADMEYMKMELGEQSSVRISLGKVLGWGEMGRVGMGCGRMGWGGAGWDEWASEGEPRPVHAIHDPTIHHFTALTLTPTPTLPRPCPALDRSTLANHKSELLKRFVSKHTRGEIYKTLCTGPKIEPDHDYTGPEIAPQRFGTQALAPAPTPTPTPPTPTTSR